MSACPGTPKSPFPVSPDALPAGAALVRVAYGSHGVVLTADGASIDCKFRRNVGRPCCGDAVQLGEADGHSMVVERILPRRNEFVRADERGRRHTVAANLDRVLVVVAPRPAPSQDLLDRYLVAVHSLGIEPVIVLNKMELAIEADSPLCRLDEYAALGYQVLRTSCKGAPGSDALLPVLAEGTSILVGQSGVGKSSLVRWLLPDLDIQVGELSRVTGKGTHTTTATTLYDLPGGGRLIDSPGVWEYGLWRLGEEELAHGFVDLRPWLGRCRFNDCRHLSEPGCAVKQAVGEGRLRDWRYQAYTRMMAQNAGGPMG